MAHLLSPGAIQAAATAAINTHAATHALAASLVSLPRDGPAEADHLPLGELVAREGP